MSVLSRRVAALEPTVFSAYSALALKHQAVNLGQGFPDFDGPEEIKQVVAKALAEGPNQYAVGCGLPALRQAIAEHAKRFYGMQVDPESMVTVTSGATEAIFDAVLGLVNEGDEVVLFEPYYDSYLASVVMAGGVPRYVRLRPPDDDHPRWWLDGAELEAAFSPRTRLVMLNTPHNPTGKVFDRAELEEIARLCRRHGALLLSDEVYEHLVYPPARHLRPATMPELTDRTVTISSGGKSFSFTGWKVGWAIAPPALRDAVQQAHQYVTFATGSVLQVGIAAALRLPDAYFAGLVRDYQRRRDLLAASLHRAGLPAFPTEGAYFLIADTRRYGFADDEAFCRHLTTEVGVAAIPPSAFYCPEHREHARFLARFAFCKTDGVLAAASERLERRAPPR